MRNLREVREVLRSIDGDLAEMDNRVSVPTDGIRIGDITGTLGIRKPSKDLDMLGYGFITRLEGSDKPSLFQIMREEPANFCLFMQKHEPGIVNLAHSIAKFGLLQPILIRPDRHIVLGQRRVLAIAYGVALSNQPVMDAVIPCSIRDVFDKDVTLLILSESNCVHSLSVMDQARLFSSLRHNGMTVQEIAEAICMDHQIVRVRLQLCKLSPEMQDAVEEGRIGIIKALDTLNKVKKKPS